MEAYDSLFELLAKAQGGRMEDQRAKGPCLSGPIVRSPTSSSKETGNTRRGLPHNTHPAFPGKRRSTNSERSSEPGEDVLFIQPPSSPAGGRGTATSRFYEVPVAEEATKSASTAATEAHGKMQALNGSAGGSVPDSTHDGASSTHAQPKLQHASAAEHTRATNHKARRAGPREEHPQSSFASQEKSECSLDGFSWFVGPSDRKRAENMLRHWPTGAFVVRRGRSSHVITLKFPVNGDKIFFHVRITHEGPSYRIAESECFNSIPELVTFYCNNPARFFRGMSKEDRKKHKLIPYRPLPKVELDVDDDRAQSEA